FRLRLGDAGLAGALRPGQFVMLRPGPEGASDPLLGRALALYDVACDPKGTPFAFDVVYLVVGRGTAALSQRQPGERLEVWGPLGNGFGPPPGGSAIFVAGGIGQTPFLALGRFWLNPESAAGAEADRCKTSVTLLYGVRTAALLAGVGDFRRAGIEVELAT